MKYQLATVVVTSGVAVNLRLLAAKLDKGDMQGMFVTGLSPTGAAPITHYASSGYVPKPLVRLLRNNVQMFNVAKKAWEDDGEVFPFTQAQITNALSKCTVVAGADDSEEDLPEAPLDTMVRLGLQLITAAA